VSFQEARMNLQEVRVISKEEFPPKKDFRHTKIKTILAKE
jgi:hypothetical protein